MQSSDIPEKFNIPFGNSAGGSYIRPIPENSQIGVNDGWASLTDGFVPLNATPPESGGIPPFMQDMNGILNQISAWSRWVGAGGPVRYDSAFQAAVGGYPRGARVLSAVTPLKIWISTAENNTTNPDSGGAGWLSSESLAYSDFTIAGSGSVTVPAWANFAEIHMIGAGGGGGGSGTGHSGGGGGSGGYSFGIIPVTPGASLPYSVGAGGTGGTGGNGASGGATTLSSYSVTGGFGGNGTTTSSGGGFGGAASNSGLRNFSGSDGGDGNNQMGNIQGGGGAAGPFGGSGRTGRPNGEPGKSSGSGGGGAWGSTSGKGGDGYSGAIFIRWLV